MGNYFSSQTIYPENLDQNGLLELIQMLGTVVSPSMDVNPEVIDNELFNSDCALSNHLEEIYVHEPNFLNRKLKEIAEFVKNKFESVDEDFSSVYPSEDEDMLFKCGHLTVVKPDTIGNYQDFQTKEFLSKFPENLERIRKVYRGFSVYQFKEDKLSAISRCMLQDTNDVQIGMHNGQFMPFNPDADAYITDCLKICWWGYLLDDETFHVFPGTGSGVTLNENGSINTMDVSGLRELTNWASTGDQDSLKRFQTWRANVEKTGQVWCLVDGEQDGDLIEFSNFLGSLELSGDVFEE
jgi:hypothetical protein